MKKLSVLAVSIGLVITSALPAAAQCGQASWYGPGFHGRRTANGEIFNQNSLTAAHPSLPFGTRVRVTRGNRSVTVRINDRGPFTGGRIIDLSSGAARQLGIIDSGVARVCLTRL
jgi:rare lipoprotein A